MKKEEREEKTIYVCEKCKAKYELTEARIKEMTCCGIPLKTEVITKSTPTPFGP